jgi:CxxC motif-containing protein (DUF1111 family)
MMRTLRAAIPWWVFVLAAHASAGAPDSGGDTTIRIFDTGAFSLPAANLSLTRRGDFFAGSSFFENPWVSAPASTSARDGLGPLFNTNACQSCHLKDGRGRPPHAGEPMTSMLVRTSIPAAESSPSGVTPEPTYGEQLQPHGVPGVPGEARVSIEWSEVRGRFADGTPYMLRRPQLRIDELAYGPLAQNALLSARVAPALIGLGLLEAIPRAAIEAGADPDDANGDGISGRANRVHDASAGTPALGRFGWKAGQPSVRQQVAAAFAGDLGITSSLYPDQPCTAAQARCRSAPAGGTPELSDDVLDLVAFYAKTLAVPGRRRTASAAIRAGEIGFRELGCTSCHVETWSTGDDTRFPELSGQQIHPYTDLLLHDMGDGLADGRPEFEASGREWRTPPLWGIGLVSVVSRHTEFLHDGRARNLEEAILWHGGEAEPAQERYLALPRTRRDQLLQFLESL